jgi:DNA repair exonuclease SbcCD ATPase subunit
MHLTKIREICDDLKVDYKAAVENHKKEFNNLTAAEDNLFNIEQAQEIAQNIAQVIQQKVHRHISGVVGRCLEIVFGEDESYVFKILFERKRNRTEARLIFERNRLEVDPLSASGGGVIDVAAFALRLSCLLLAKPELRRVVILDEPFKFVSEEYRPKVREMLERLSKDFHIQFIMVTHIDELVTGKVFRL